MIRMIQFAATVALTLTLAACGGDDDSALRDQIAMLEMERDEATTAKMTAEGQIADLQAEVTQLESEITMLMGRADISAADLAALRSEAETLRGQLAGRADISTADLAALRSQVETLRADVARLTDEKTTAEGQVAGLQAEVEQLNGRITTLMDHADISAADLAALRSQVETLTGQLAGRADISPENLAVLRSEIGALRAEVARLMGRADISPEDLADLRNQIETDAQDMSGSQIDAAMANAVEKVVAGGLRHEISPEHGGLESTSGWRITREAYSGSGSEFAALSQTHKYGDAIEAAIPWRDENGELQLYVSANPGRGSLSDNIGAYTWTNIETQRQDRDGVTTSYDPTEAHGLGSAWHGFELTKAYAGDGTWKVRLFTDIEASDVLTDPYHDWDESEFEAYEHQILLDDARVPAAPGRDGLFIVIPEDGLSGSLNGVAGRFSCTGGYCALNNAFRLSRYIPWFDSGAIRFTPADGSQSEVILEIPHIETASSIPKANYLSLGSWWYLPDDATDIDAYEFGVFAGGDDPFMAGNLPALTGTASYAGKAAGTYAETIRPQTESFTANVDLTAAFGSEGNLGRVTGEVSGFRLESGKPMPVNSVRLQPYSWEEPGTPNIRTSWDDGGNLIPGGLIEGDTVADGGWHGEWGGRFFGNSAGDPAAHPTSLAGTFGATDGTRSIAGSFGAHRQ